MRTALLCCFLFLCLPVVADVPITDVTVFTDRAEVTRSADLDLKKGDNRITIEGLPWQFVESSIRVAVPNGRVRVPRVEVEPVFKRLVREEEAATLQKELKALQARADALSARALRVGSATAFIENLKIRQRAHDPDKAPPPVALDAAAWMKVLDFVAASMADLSGEARAIREERDKAMQEVEVLATKLHRLSSKDVKQYKNGHVHLVAEAAGRVPLRVTYRVAGPQWFPTYEVLADVPNGKVKLVAYALVRQRTGEDWKGARLTFSTVDLSVSAELPELATRRISPAGMLELKPTIVLRPPSPPAKAPPAGPQPRAVRATAGLVGGYSLDQVRGTLAGVAAGVRVSGGTGATGPGGTGQGRAPGKETLSYVGRNRKLRQLYSDQRGSLKAGRYMEFAQYNDLIRQNILTLPQEQQDALSDLNTEAIDNWEKAQRLIKSEKLGRDLVVPKAAAQGVDHRFAALAPANVYSEWVFTRAPYLEAEIPVTFVHESAPILKQLSYLVAIGKNTLDKPLLPGPVAAFIGLDFVGESRLELRPTGADLRFDLSVDRAVEVRRQIERERDTSGMMFREYNYEYKVTVYVTNRKKRLVKTVVIDRMPFAYEDAGVTVKRLGADPPPKTTSHEGLVRWELDLKPGETRELTFRYGVSHRTNRVVMGSEKGGVLW